MAESIRGAGMSRLAEWRVYMKRYIGLLLTIVCVTALNGCGKNNAAETETNSGMESTVEDISALFTEKGYSVECKSVEQQILSGERYRIVLDSDLDKQVVVYVYDNSEKAAVEAGYIDESGNCVIMTDTDGEITSTTNIDWASVPHYYLYDNMIVQYVGLDEEILALLSEFCGEQFAGGNNYLSKP